MKERKILKELHNKKEALAQANEATTDIKTKVASLTEEVKTLQFTTNQEGIVTGALDEISSSVVELEAALEALKLKGGGDDEETPDPLGKKDDKRGGQPLVQPVV